jgi:hypothetical protein
LVFSRRKLLVAGGAALAGAAIDHPISKSAGVDKGTRNTLVYSLNAVPNVVKLYGEDIKAHLPYYAHLLPALNDERGRVVLLDIACRRLSIHPASVVQTFFNHDYFPNPKVEAEFKPTTIRPTTHGGGEDLDRIRLIASYFSQNPTLRGIAHDLFLNQRKANAVTKLLYRRGATYGQESYPKPES